MATLDTLMKTGWGDSRTRNLLVGSCEISDACNSSLTDPFLGNDICNDYDPYNTEECCWDGGDCVKVFGDCNATHETCAGDISLLGDGYCDANNKNDWYTGYNTEGCCWDGGDCSRPKPEGLEGVGTFVFVALSFTLCTLFRAKLHSNRRNAAATNAGPTPRPVVEQASLSAAEDRRQLILMSIIHKKVKSKSKAPAEQDVVVDLEGATQANEGMDLPHEKILSLRNLNTIPVVQNDTPAAEQLNGDGGSVDNFDDNDDGIFDKTKDDILVGTLRSIKSSLHITIIDDSSLYSPKSCPICCDEYVKGDDIAWSKNEQCCHAFHTDCIIDWLMNHDDCPMCRNNYLEETEEAWA